MHSLPSNLADRSQQLTAVYLTSLRRLGCIFQPTTYKEGVKKTYAELRKIAN